MNRRVWLSFAAALAAACALTQGDPPSQKQGTGQGSQPQSMGRPDATIVIREHQTSADMVQVTMARPDYPHELLRSQLEALGTQLNSPPRGLTVATVELDPNNENLKFVKATFAINGILEKAASELNIEPLLKAFAGAPDPYRIEHLLIIFDGERPGPKTVKSHASDSVEARASYVTAPAQIEYHVQLKTQDPGRISFPAKAPEQPPAEKPSEESSRSPLLFYAALALGALAAGALVYLALLRSGGWARR